VLNRRAVRACRERRRPVRVVRAPPVTADEAVGDQFLQRADHLAGLAEWQIAHVQLIEVDPVGTQPPQRRLAGLADVAGRGVLPGQRLPRGIVGVAELGRDHHIVAVRRQCPAEHLFAVAGAVGVRGVEERDAQVERPADRGGRLTVVDRTPPVRFAVHRERAANGPAAKADRADLDAAAAQNPRAHLCPSVV
jgi:hypothetical protein